MSSRPLSTASRPADLPRLRRALDYVPEGDMLVVWKLDRLGRPLAGVTALAFLDLKAPESSTRHR